MNAYDYEKQQWIDGDAATDLLRQQLTETLELLTGPRGAEYARFINANRETLIAKTREELARL